MNDPGLIKIIVVGCALSVPLGLFVFVALKIKFNHLKKILESVAVKWGGQVVISQLQFYPNLKFTLWGRDITMSFKMEGRRGMRGSKIPPKTIIQAQLTSASPVELIVFYKDLIHEMDSHIGLHLQDILIGNSHFDEPFVVKGKEPSRVVSILKADIQQKMLEISSWNPKLKIQNNSFSFEVSIIPASEADIDKLIELTRDILSKV